MDDNVLNNEELSTFDTIHNFSKIVSIVWLFILLATSIFYCLFYLGNSYNHVSDFIVTVYVM